MRPARWARSLALIGVIAVFAGCQQAAPRSGPSPSPAAPRQIWVRLPYALKTLDPALVSSQAETGVLRQLRQPLLNPSPGLGGVTGGAAESWQVSPDGLTYTFKLRADARYSDGQPVRAQDFVFAWRRLLDPRLASPVADLFAAVVAGGVAAQALDPIVDVARIDPALDRLGLAAPDEHTFVVHLPGGSGQMPWLATMPQGAPVRADQVARGPGWPVAAETWAGNGPFRLGSVDLAHRVELEPNPFAGAARGTGRLGFEVVGDEALALAEYDAGRLDVAELDSADPGSRTRRFDVLQLTGFWLDLNNSRPPLDSVALRQAIAAAVDRAALVAGPLKGRAAPLGELAPAGLAFHDPSGEQALDLVRARAALQAGGIDPATLAPLVLLVGPEPGDRAVAQAVAAQLNQNLGLKIRVDAVDAATLEERRYDRDWDLTGPRGWSADYPDGQDWFDIYRTVDGRNLAHWRSQRYDLLVGQADADADQSRRPGLYRQAQMILLDEAPAVFLYQRQSWNLVRPAVRGVVTTPLDEWPGALNAAGLRKS